ncbi:MAG: hypothetical protein K9H26_19130, partial [Prolixibacteraceae bacterium]|nr:hypothetical protein [Prolixibacteraceae bacterium]
MNISFSFLPVFFMFEFSVAAGASLAYISFTYFTNTQMGYYIDFWENEGDFYMVSPYYTRI